MTCCLNHEVFKHLLQDVLQCGSQRGDVLQYCTPCSLGLNPTPVIALIFLLQQPSGMGLLLGRWLPAAAPPALVPQQPPLAVRSMRQTLEREYKLPVYFSTTMHGALCYSDRRVCCPRAGSQAASRKGRYFHPKSIFLFGSVE